MPSRIVAHAYRPKRAPRKQAKAYAINGPVIVTVTSKRDRHREAADDGQGAGASALPLGRLGGRKPLRKSSLLNCKNKPVISALVAD
jgi:hypothetical protein